MPEPAPRRPTVAIYDRPPWWRTRRFWRIALPAIVTVAALAIWIIVLA
jgi:hypothetical protein